MQQILIYHLSDVGKKVRRTEDIDAVLTILVIKIFQFKKFTCKQILWINVCSNLALSECLLKSEVLEFLSHAVVGGGIILLNLVPLGVY